MTISCGNRESATKSFSTANAQRPIVHVGRCQPTNADVSTWKRFDAKSAPISFLLPAGAKTVARVSTGGNKGETWRAGDLTVLYRLRGTSPADTSRSPNLEDYTVCADTVDGRAVRITSYYSNATTLPGEFVFGVWQMPDGRELAVHAQARSRSSADALHALIRAVRFR